MDEPSLLKAYCQHHMVLRLLPVSENHHTDQQTIECICIVSAGKLALEFTADEFKTSVCKSYSMTISISRDCPFSFAHADQKKQTIIVFSISVAIVIIVVISICLGCFTFQRVDGNDADLIFIFLADVLKFI